MRDAKPEGRRKDNERANIVFKALEWNLDRADERTEEIIYINGITADRKSVVLSVEGFTPFVNVELPPLRGDKGRKHRGLTSNDTGWTDEKVDALLTYVSERFQHCVLQYKLTNKCSYYLKKPGTYLRVAFGTQRACNAFRYFMAKRHEIPGLGVFERDTLKVHESNVDPIIKLTAVRKLPLGGWIEAKDVSISKGGADVMGTVFYKDLRATTVPPHVRTQPMVVVFDGEMYSMNHDAKQPNSEPKENEIIQLSVIAFRAGDPIDKWKKYLIARRRGYDLHVEGTKVFHCDSERSVIRTFIKLVKLLNPDVMTGYNILKFDWDYIIKRAILHEVYDELITIGRLPDVPCNRCEKKWKSSAYGFQKFQYLEVPGRLNLDVLMEVERNYKFDSYSLDNVAKHFLGEGKRELSAKQLFKLYKFAMQTERYHGLEEITETQVRIIKRIASKIFTEEEEGIAEEFYASILEADASNVIERMKVALDTIGDYCVVDSIVTGKLLEKLNIITGSEQLANVFCVPISYLQMRGQQVKVMAQLYRYTLYHGIVIPFYKYNEDDEEEHYWGAFVWDANKGLWVLVITEDFASLYPSAMISKNIDHTTYIDPLDTSVPDELCHVIEWDEHHGCGCPGDTAKKKIPKSKVLCAHKRHRFLKVVEKDGERLNEGVLPFLLRNLLENRNKTKDEIAALKKKLKEDPNLTDEEKANISLQLVVLDCKQLALKVSANSMYGGAGARKGYFPFIPVAESVTATGREYIKIATDYVTKRFPNVKIVYGDSVSEHTPILCRVKDGRVSYRTIRELSDGEWVQIGEKEESNPLEGLEVWTDEGFSKVKRVIRHKTQKKMFRVLTHTGYVEVTEDHSLLRPDGDVVKPKDLEIGDELLSKALPSTKTFPTTITTDEAWVMGFFYADGSCGSYACPSGKKHSWAINKLDLNLLEDAKRRIEEVETECEFEILDTVGSSHVYKLVPKAKRIGAIRKLVEKYRKLFYYEPERHKRIPDEILNASEHVMQSFWDGYYAGDGDKTSGSVRCDNKGQIGAAGLFYLAKRLGYQVSINTRSDKPEIFRLNASDPTKKQRKNPIAIKKIETLPTKERIVYDLETENHHFSAGIGEIIVHNTDSCMIHVEGASREEVFELGRRISKEVTALFPPPVRLEFECVYGKFLLLTKKRYVAEKINEKGEVIEETVKGVVSKRRDNTKYLKNTYNNLIRNVMKSRDEAIVMSELCDDVHKLFTRQIESKNLIIYKGIGSLIEYAKSESETFEDPSTGEKYTLTWFLDKSKKRISNEDGTPVQITDPLDPRLSYDNNAHVALALKMMARGDEVLPNTRLQYVFLDVPGTLQSERVEDYSYYRENRLSQNLRLDPLYYLEKQLVNPVSEVVNAIYRKEMIPLETIDEKISAVEHKLFAKLPESLRETVRECKRCILETFSRNLEKPCDYKNRIKMAIVQIKNGRRGDRNLDAIISSFEKLVKLCFTKKSSIVIDRLEHIFGMKKRPAKRPIPKTNGLYVRDGSILEDMLKYRTGYRNTVDHLKRIFESDRDLPDSKVIAFERMNHERERKLRAIDAKIYENARRVYASE